MSVREWLRSSPSSSSDEHASREAAKAAYDAGRAAHPLSLQNAFVLSLPKSGRTYLVCLLGQLFSRASVPQEYSDSYLRQAGLMYTHGRDHPIMRYPLTTEYSLVATSRWVHGRACRRSGDHRKPPPRLLLLDRDPRDQLVSAFYESKFRSESAWGTHLFNGTLSEFVPRGVRELLEYNTALRGGLELALRNCTPSPSRLALVRFERLVACPSCVLTMLLDGWLSQTPLSTARPAERGHAVAAAVARCNFTVMRALPSFVGRKWGEAIPGEPSSNKFRRGLVGGWPDELTPADGRRTQRLLDESGYARVRLAPKCARCEVM